MDTNLVLNDGFNELVFENRHKNYGAFMIRKRYRRNVLVAAVIASSFVLLCAFGAVATSSDAAAAVRPPDERVLVTQINTKTISDPVVVPPKPRLVNPPPKGPDNANLSRIELVDSTTTKIKMDSAGTSTHGVVGGTGTSKDTTCIGCLVKDSVIHTQDPPPIVDWVEKMPDCYDIDAIFSKNIHYPQMAKEQGIQGTVYLEFVVDVDGKVTDVGIAKGVNPLLDREVLRVAANLPPCTPGLQNGKPVRVRFHKPVKFKLN